MSPYLAIILFGTAILTYGIRVLPFLSRIMNHLPESVRQFLRILPVAALGALLFPGSILALPDHPLAGILSVCAAALTAWFIRGSLILPVLASIGVTWLILMTG